MSEKNAPMLVWPRPAGIGEWPKIWSSAGWPARPVELVDVGGNHAGDDLAVAQAGAGEDPAGRVGDPEADVQPGLEEAGVGVPDEVVLRPADRRVRPLAAGDQHSSWPPIYGPRAVIAAG
jgi:hypothetical protein